MTTSPAKDASAFRTIGELSAELGVAQHILRYWETKFPQLKPMQRAGNRRYYRPADVDLARRINRLLSDEGYTVRGVQKLLRDKAAPTAVPTEQFENASIAAAMSPIIATAAIDPPETHTMDHEAVKSVRDRLANALSA